MNKEVIEWLLKGDPVIKYWVNRDLLNSNKRTLQVLQENMEQEGWVKKLLLLQDKNTYIWGNGLYSPKWISTTYTMLTLKDFGIRKNNSQYVGSAMLLTEKLWYNSKLKKRYLDLCICGMVLNIACYSNIQHENIFEIVDFILKTQMDDGGWNCRLNDKPHHSSLHTTINVLEGLKEYINSGYVYRKTEILNAMEKAHEFILVHKLYKSDKTNQVIDKKMTMLSYPSRWRYDILRALDYFQSIDFQYDPRMEDALNLSLKKKLKSNKWPLQQKYPGRVFFDFEKVGKESRINTVRALRVLKKYGKVIK